MRGLYCLLAKNEPDVSATNGHTETLPGSISVCLFARTNSGS